MRGRLLPILLLALIVAGCAKPAGGLIEFYLPMGYIANVQFSPFYMAQERGYFRDAGFAPTFDYRWETDGIQLVAAGEIPFTIASGDQVIQARSKGLPVVAVAPWYRRFPVAVIALADQPLASPGDLAGLRVGIPETFGASYIGLRALLEEAHLSEDDIELHVIGYTQLASLTSETVDAAVVYANNEPVVLAQQGIAYNAIYVADYATIVSAVIVSSDAYVKDHPRQVRAFVSAFQRGLSDVIADPDAAFEVSKTYIEGLESNADVQYAVLTTSIDYWKPAASEPFDARAWEEAQAVMVEAGLLDVPTPLDQLYTDVFLK